MKLTGNLQLGSVNLIGLALDAVARVNALIAMLLSGSYYQRSIVQYCPFVVRVQQHVFVIPLKGVSIVVNAVHNGLFASPSDEVLWNDFDGGSLVARNHQGKALGYGR